MGTETIRPLAPAPFVASQIPAMGLGRRPSSPLKQVARGVLLLGCLGLWAVAKADVSVIPDEPGNTPLAPSGEVSSTPSCWIYTHLQKSGGSTTKQIIMNAGVRSPDPCDNCGVYYEIYDSPQWERGNEWTKTFADRLVAPSGINVAMGGYTEALRRSPQTESNCRWFTQFRHPITRLVSAFFYCKKAPGDNLCAFRAMPAEAHSSLLAFAKHWGNFGLRQFALGVLPLDGSSVKEAEKGSPSGWYLQRKYMEEIGGDNESDSKPDEVMSHILTMVQDRLRTFAAVGILEEFNTTLSLYNATLGIPGVDWHEGFRKIGVANYGKFRSSESPNSSDHATTWKPKP